MAWTYGGNPASSPADALRLLIGDTNPNDPMLTDAEVAYFLQVTGNDPLAAAVFGVEALVARFTYAVDQSVGSVSISFSQRLANLRGLLDSLRYRVAVGGSLRVLAGGISAVEQEANESNVDIRQPAFKKHSALAEDDWQRRSPYLPLTKMP